MAGPEQSIYLLQQLLNEAEDTAIAVVDADFRLVYLNNTAERFFHCSAKAALGRLVRDLHIRGKVSEARFQEAVEQIRAGHAFEYRVEQPSEEGIRYIGMHLSGLWKSGQLAGYLLLARDITERYESELETQRESEYYRDLYEHAPAPYHSLDAEAHIRHVNPAWMKAFHCTEKEVIGHSLYEFIDEDQKPAFRKAFKQFKQSGRLCGLVLKMRRCDGEGIVVSLTGRAIYDEQGQFHHSHCILLDITEQERNRRDLELFRFALEKSGDAVYWLKPEGKLLYVNEAACRQLGYTRRELLAKHIWEIDTKVDVESCREIWQQLREETTLRMESIHRRKDGSEFPVEITANHLTCDGEEFNCALVRDVSEKRKVEAELRQAQKMEALGQLTSGIAHDFNNILASILGFTQLSLIELQAERKEKLVSYLKEIDTAGRRGKALIEQMLRFTRRDSHEQQRLQLEPLLQEIVRLARSTLPSSILIQPTLQADGLSIIADPVQIHQAVMNLCVNARDAMDSKGVLGIRLQWRRNFEFECSGCRCKASGDWVVITVEDDGPGIPANIREQVFEPFFTTKAPGKGTGMGLAVVQSVVHQNHGHILLESSEGRGTRFHLLFPPAQESDSSPKWQTDREEMPGFLSGNVLVVDDEPAVLSVICALLDHEGLRATAFHDAEEALKHFHEDPDAFDLAVVDQTMPRMTGVELIEQLHKERSTLPVILCTGFSDSVNEKNAMEYGITTFLRKPVELRTLRHALINTLAQRGSDNQ